MKNLYETIFELDYFKVLQSIIQIAEMQEFLKNEGPFTLFGPHDGAFETFTTYDAEDMAHYFVVAPLEKYLSSKDSASKAMRYFLVSGQLTLGDLIKRTSITALDGNDIPIDQTDGDNIIVGNSYVMNTDIECTNGIIHVTGEVLSPTL